jgi:large subunit ribosomal protein L24e
VGASLEVIQKKRAEKPEVRDAAREAALRYVFYHFYSHHLYLVIMITIVLVRQIEHTLICSLKLWFTIIPQLISNCHDSCSEIKERIKKTKDEKKAKKAEVAKSQKGQTKGAVQKGSKGPKLGGGGGKR